MPSFSPAPLVRRRSSPLSTSSRLSFFVDRIDALRSQSQPPSPLPSDVGEGMRDVLKKEVEVFHPWPEWIELMQRLAQQNYFGSRRDGENLVARNVGIDLSGIKDDMGFDFSRDWTDVRNACVNFGRERFDILRSLSQCDLRILVGYGCPSMDPNVVLSAKLLRKLVHLDEGDVCSSCNLRNSCNRGYILSRKEDEARTLDVMRILFTYSFAHVNGCVENKPLTEMKSVKSVVRKLLHEVVKLGAVPIDPNLPPPVIKKPPPKVKKPPPLPKKRLGRDDVEMKKGDWPCTKCGYMNFAKNSSCLKCDAKRPTWELLPGEWECPGCNFLNYRRNMVCRHCEHKRPTYTEDQHQAKQPGPRIWTDRTAKMQDVSNAWNFDFDDNELDGADVAAFEFADSHRDSDEYSLDNLPCGKNGRRYEDAVHSGRQIRKPRGYEEGTQRIDCPRTAEQGGCSKETGDSSILHSNRTGFDDFDDEEEDDHSYELEGSDVIRGSEFACKNFSELENSDPEGFDKFDQ